jgi:hypothetical protein
MHNNCGYGLQPTVVSCIDLPPGTQCNAYTGGQPAHLNPGASTSVTVPDGVSTLHSEARFLTQPITK